MDNAFRAAVLLLPRLDRNMTDMVPGLIDPNTGRMRQRLTGGGGGQALLFFRANFSEKIMGVLGLNYGFF